MPAHYPTFGPACVLCGTPTERDDSYACMVPGCPCYGLEPGSRQAGLKAARWHRDRSRIVEAASIAFGDDEALPRWRPWQSVVAERAVTRMSGADALADFTPGGRLWRERQSWSA
jgi:hypothetical protein